MSVAAPREAESSATSIQEFLDLDEGPVNPVVTQSARTPSQIVDSLALEQVHEAEAKKVRPRPSKIEPPLLSEQTLTVKTSPKRPRFWERNSEYSKSQDVTMVQTVKAKSMFELEDTSMHPEDYAAYLGKDDAFNTGVRTAFMLLFDFTGSSIIKALRQMCARLYIRGETQVIDRLLEAFAMRWRFCNIEEKYLTQDVTYIIAFALITLNTDLHTAGLESDQKMKKSQFVQNTMHAIESGRSEGSQPLASPTANLTQDQSIRVVKRAVSSESNLGRAGSVRKSHTENFARATQILKETRDAYLKTVLEDFYVSVKSAQIQQPAFAVPRPDLDRANSVASRTSSISRGAFFRRDTPEQRSLQGSANNSVVSFDQFPDGSASERSGSAYGRTLSLTNSRVAAGSRASSASRFSMRGSAPRGIGFMGSLANAMIREEATSPTKSSFGDVLDIQEKQDEELTLSGPPFAKEGRVRHKYVPKLTPRRPKSKGWSNELFAVLERGQLRLFDFSQKSKLVSGAGVGGGDWTENAKTVVDLDLVQALALALPYASQSKQHPYVWNLTLPNGDSHLFAVGTEILIHEWTSTANYWAARITKEPLMGTVDSAEYGWGKILDVAKDNEDMELSTPSAERRPSEFMKDASRFDFIAAQFPGNKVVISEWQPDPVFAVAVTTSPVEQLRALQKHLDKIDAEIKIHTTRRSYITRAFSPKHQNLTKALQNYDRRQEYLKLEKVKFSNYVLALEVGISRARGVQGHSRDDSLGSMYSLQNPQ